MAIGASAQAQTIPGNVRVVDQNAPGPGEDGLTWPTAFQDLQAALANMDPDAVPFPVNEIWVAQGTYLPDGNSPGGRTLSFNLLNNVQIYGGFAGGETSRGQRNPKTNVTILSGDLLGDDDPGDPFGLTNDENSFHVIKSFNVNFTAIVDGFTIRGGNADGGPGNRSGGGALIVNGNPGFPAHTLGPLFNQCIFEDNRADGSGGAVSVPGFLDLQANLTNCIIRNNQADGSGGGISAAGGKARLFKCELDGNETDGAGGGILTGNSVELIHCIVIGNSAAQGGGVHTSALIMSSCQVIGNEATLDGGGVWAFSTLMSKIINCQFTDNIEWDARPGMPSSSGLRGMSTSQR